ncbi:MAG: hypothetical protein ACF8K1_10480 [Phycisphaerales bacterium JB047]
MSKQFPEMPFSNQEENLCIALLNQPLRSLEQPFELSKGQLLRRPDEAEREVVKWWIRNRSISDPSIAYEAKLRTELWGEVGGAPFEEEYFYAVLEISDFSGGTLNAAALALERSGVLLEESTSVPIRFQMTFTPNGVMTYSSDFSENIGFEILDLDGDALKKWSSINALIDGFSQDYGFIVRSHEIFFDALSRISSKKHRFLFVFAALECLLTHQNSGKDDTLTRQLSTKIPLIAHMLNRSPPEFTSFDTEIEFWKAMYGIRSCYAHGSEIDLSSKRFSKIGDLNLAKKYVIDMTRVCIRFAYQNPVLFNDLASC